MTATATAELSVCRRVSVVHGTGEAVVHGLIEVDLTIHRGERVALFGPSGSGKTTLLHVLGGLIVPEHGEVIWRGQPLSALDADARARERARGIALVFQGANLLPTLTAYENVAFAARASGADRGSADRDGAAELLTLVGLGAKLDALPGELSGGEAQRVAIARSLAQQPSLLLCDEPTGHLDSDTGTRVLDLIDVLADEFGFALVIATHDADVASRYGRSVALSDGRIVGETTFA